MNQAFAFSPATWSGVPLTASTTTSRVSVDGSSSQTVQGVRVVNEGSAVAYIVAGDSTVVATTSGLRVMPNSVEVFLIPPLATHMAAITASGTAQLSFTIGMGV